MVVKAFLRVFLAATSSLVQSSVKHRIRQLTVEVGPVEFGDPHATDGERSLRDCSRIRNDQVRPHHLRSFQLSRFKKRSMLLQR